MATINPYITFNGNCEEAFLFYKSVFGGDFRYVGRFKEMPKNPDYAVDEADLEKIMHISLPISKETILMGSDTSEAFGGPVNQGSNFSISITVDTIEETTRIFNALSEGGNITMPLEKTFWGSFFGTFTDQYGIHWMVGCDVENNTQ